MKRYAGSLALVAALLLVAPTAALADGHSNAGGSATADEHRQNGSDEGRAKGGRSGSDHDGDADNTPGRTTENDDSDGLPNNVPDEGDNRHPSTKDRSVEHGNSGNQGNSESNPDNDGHGPERNSCPGSGVGECVDKPGGDGGVDEFDQDGNNGCGNDDDFEDDNEGWCGKPEAAPAQNVVELNDDGALPVVDVIEDGALPLLELDEDAALPALEDEVQGLRIQRRPATPVAAARQARNVTVLGAVLPFTGANVLLLLGASIALMVAGAVALKVRRTS